MPKSIPFELVELEPESYHILVDATINGEPVKLIVDSGASRSVFDKIYDSGQRIEGISETVAVGFMSDNVNIELASIPSLIVVGVKFKDFPIALADLSSLRELYKSITGFNVAGLLGCDFLVQNVSTINFRSKKIFILEQNRN
ncbi:MAG TPA: retropepsin-like aspartic protease [Tenuifilaceae bacterium]|nr:retropepsin-like aspartic protease [Tenuifilaceae bacterium]HPI45740.1 retropepsin-like aspartic protease [Tenuifilaceae bacterium]HPN21052.1 retropepsin-like aspartic protease [Tenuifilaceae bacterium]